MKTVHLINNRKKEKAFATAFSHVAKELDYNFSSLSSLELSYHYNRADRTTTIYQSSNIFPLNTEDVFFVRSWAPSEDATALFCLLLEQNKIAFTDAKVNTKHEIRTSKLSQTFQLAHRGCSCPSTWVVPLRIFSKIEATVIETLQLPLVIKARGGLGKRVWKCSTKAELRSKVTELKRAAVDDLIVLQEYIPNESDIRIITYKNNILAAIERSSSDGFLNNVSQGGTAQKVSITKQEERLAKRAAYTIGLDLAGVDIVRTDDGPLVFEVNKAPDITAFHQPAGFNIAEAIARQTLTS